MVTFVLEASAILRYLDGEPGVDRVDDVLHQFNSGSVEAVISSMQWGEAFGVFLKRYGLNGAASSISDLRALALTIIPVTAERAERCALIKAEHRIPFVDALAVELADSLPNSILLTADFDMKPAESFISIEFLPSKQKL